MLKFVLVDYIVQKQCDPLDDDAATEKIRNQIK